MSQTFTQAITNLLLQKDFNPLKKKDFTQIYEWIVELFLDSGKTKSSLAESITNKLLSQLKIMIQANKSTEEIVTYLTEFFQANGLRMNEAKRVFFENLVSQKFDGGGLSSRDSRGIQQSIPNIWKQNFKIVCVCQQPSKIFNKEASQQPCYICGRMFHIECFWQKETDELFECPFCFLQNFNPTKEVKEVLFAGYMTRNNRCDKNECKIEFNISHDLKKDKNIIIEARSARLSNKARFQLTWPDNCVINLAGKKLADFKPLTKSSPLKRRNDQEIRLQKSMIIGSNELIIEQKEASSEDKNTKIGRSDHLVMIVAVVQQNQEIIKKKFEKKIMEVAYCRKSLKKYINKSTSNEVSIQKFSVSLQCQYFRTSILWPVRSKHCISHYQPFDLCSFITASMTAKNSTLKWKCPICKKRAYDLVVDEYLLNIIRKNKNLNIKQITIKALDSQPQIIEQELEKDASSWEQNQQKQSFKFLNRNHHTNQGIVKIQPNHNHNTHTIILDSQNQQILPQQEVNPPNLTQISIPQDVNRQGQLNISILINSIERYQQRQKLAQQLNPVVCNDVVQPINALKDKSKVINSINVESQDEQQQNEQNLEPSEKKRRSNQTKYEENQEPVSQVRKLRKLLDIQVPVVPNNIQLYSPFKINRTIPSFAIKINPQDIIQKPALTKSSNKMDPIQIESDEETEQERLKKKIQQQRSLLQEIRKSLNKKYNDSAITQSDTAVFQNICCRFVDINLKD